MCYSTELRLLQNAIHPYGCHAGLIFARNSYLEAARLLAAAPPEEKARNDSVTYREAYEKTAFAWGSNAPRANLGYPASLAAWYARSMKGKRVKAYIPLFFVGWYFYGMFINSIQLGIASTFHPPDAPDSEYLSSSSGSSFSLPRRMPCISEVEPRSTTCSISAIKRGESLVCVDPKVRRIIRTQKKVTARPVELKIARKFFTGSAIQMVSISGASGG